MASAVLARPDIALPPPATSHNSSPPAPPPPPPPSDAPAIPSATANDSVFHRPLWPARQRRPRSRSGHRMAYNNAVYYPNWRLLEPDKSPASMEAEAISHVFYAFARVAEDGTVKLSMEHEDDEMLVDGHRGGIRATLALKEQNPSLKVIMSIGGGEEKASEMFALVASDGERRQRCARTAREMVDRYGLDGIDIDWENLYSQVDCHNYLQLLADMRRALPAPYFMLTSVLSAREWLLKYLDLRRVCSYLDVVNLTAYDFYGNWSQYAGHASGTDMPAVLNDGNVQSTTVLSALRYYIMQNGIPSHKINIGIPCFGRSFLGATRAGDKYTGHGGNQGIFSYYDLPRDGAIESFDDQALAAYSVGGDGGFVSHDNPNSVASKARLVRGHNLAGLYFWDAPGDARGCRSIVLAGALNLAEGNAY